jgi:hypothetical protein
MASGTALAARGGMTTRSGYLALHLGVILSLIGAGCADDGTTNGTTPTPDAALDVARDAPSTVDAIDVATDTQVSDLMDTADAPIGTMPDVTSQSTRPTPPTLHWTEARPITRMALRMIAARKITLLRTTPSMGFSISARTPWCVILRTRSSPTDNRVAVTRHLRTIASRSQPMPARLLSAGATV